MARKYIGFGSRPQKIKRESATTALRRSRKLTYALLSDEQKKAYRKKQRELKNSGCMLYLLIATTATLSLILTVI